MISAALEPYLMPFAYYQHLNKQQKAIYRQSDKRTTLALPDPARIKPAVIELQRALAAEDLQQTQLACAAICIGFYTTLEIPEVSVTVLESRPHDDWGELHGLYEPEEEQRLARITVWMRTAKRKQVVAFRTFFRTLLHEICHHLDYEYLQLADSFHTQGFYQREADLFKQLFDDA